MLDTDDTSAPGHRSGLLEPTSPQLAPGPPGPSAAYPDIDVPDFGEDGLDHSMRDATRRDHARLLRTLVLGVDVAALLSPALWSELTWWELGNALVTVSLLALGGAYTLRMSLSALAEVPYLVPRLGAALLLLAPFVLLLGPPDVALAVHALTAVPAFVLGRAISYALIRWARRRRLVEEPAIILGGGRLGMELLTLLFEHPEYGLRAVGFLDGGSQLDERSPLGAVADVDAVFDRYKIRKVILAFGTTREADLVSVVRSAVLRDIELYVIPRFFEIGLAPAGPYVDNLWGVPVYRVRRAALRRGAWRVKRLMDVVVAGGLLVVLSPLLALLAAGVRLSSPGPVLFRQTRVGQLGREITVLKFRTLRMAAPDAEPGDEMHAPVSSAMRARSVDVRDRATAIGKLLRRTSLDELPQLWNIVRGDMSLVGPRPEERSYAARFTTSVYGYRDRHRLAVGLTGLAQVNGLRGDTSLHERARFDNHYIENWSIWEDVAILARTLGAVVRQALTSR